MYLLSIDSHSNQCLITLSREGRLLSAFVSNEPNKHDKLLAEFTRRIISDNNITIDDISGIGIIAGPGSFTGLRIGFSFVKGIVIEKEIKLLKIPTTEIYAYQSRYISNAIKKEKIIVMVPGSSNKIFKQEFNNEAIPITEVITVEDNQILLDDRYLYVGCCDENNLKYELHIGFELNYIKPASISELTFKKFMEGNFVDLSNFEPDYYFDFIPRTK